MTHEAGEAARSFVDALKDQPLSLALVVMNIALIGYLYYDGASNKKLRTDEMALLYRNQRETSQLLARCTLPQGTTPLPKDYDDH
jgi:hypothetical protein